MADGQRLTVGHYASNVQKARKKLHEALQQPGITIPPQVQGAFNDADRAIKEYLEAKKREEKSREKRDSII